MAKKAAQPTTVPPGGTVILPFPQQQAITAPANGRRRGAVQRRRGRRKGSRRGRPVGGGGGFLNQERIGAMVGGFLLGMIDKQGTAVPTIPMLGRAGTVGVALYFAGKQFKMPILVHSSTAALAVATYQIGREGKIAGDVDGVDTV